VLFHLIHSAALEAVIFAAHGFGNFDANL